ncbi:uncharacterized protein MONBRDRAFT_12054 [Monosiga brevicollis MX1]|uniref:Tryptophan synthase beta chain-like PALP domain-containing protein n=1 Tax=Monosiga brevicollis TaxID=81824 RepID=A9VB30_MONBE|nr:uncharacterized protein MONBRDRAFT_12054 [Monosiga brevicollis MX1]EDQ85267.1 predicted protein [Monosiga brevicollis MX1]|eukprot:XP_001749888.1 hypothetical protein [Monosiga brevicollis MX1]
MVTGLAGLIGRTPLVEATALSKRTGCRILLKMEAMNPGGSSKDRIALNIIETAERDGWLKPGGTVIEGTAGSTGISLALLARARGYRCIIVMADDMAMEKEILLRTLGAEVHRVKAVSFVNNQHFCRVAEALATEIPGGFYVNQFENAANFLAHYHHTGPEIWAQTSGVIDAFVMGAGTGGTLAGVGTFLKEQSSDIHVVLADPPGSALYRKVKNGVIYTSQQAEQRLQRNRYDTILEGVGIDRLTRNFALGQAAVDDAYQVTDAESVTMAYWLLAHEGLFIGSSSALNLVAAVKLARTLPAGSTIVTCICDQGNRGMSKVYNDAFLESKDLLAAAQHADIATGCLDFVC